VVLEDEELSEARVLLEAAFEGEERASSLGEDTLLEVGVVQEAGSVGTRYACYI